MLRWEHGKNRNKDGNKKRNERIDDTFSLCHKQCVMIMSVTKRGESRLRLTWANSSCIGNTDTDSNTHTTEKTFCFCRIDHWALVLTNKTPSISNHLTHTLSPSQPHSQSKSMMMIRLMTVTNYNMYIHCTCICACSMDCHRRPLAHAAYIRSEQDFFLCGNTFSRMGDAVKRFH